MPYMHLVMLCCISEELERLLALTVIRKDSCSQHVDKIDFGQVFLQFYAEKSGKREKKS